MKLFLKIFFGVYVIPTLFCFWMARVHNLDCVNPLEKFPTILIFMPGANIMFGIVLCGQNIFEFLYSNGLGSIFKWINELAGN